LTTQKLLDACALAIPLESQRGAVRWLATDHVVVSAGDGQAGDGPDPDLTGDTLAILLAGVAA
jgi:hypothetical protein